MHILGVASLGLAFFAVLVSVVAFIVNRVMEGSIRSADKKSKESLIKTSQTVSLIGYIGVFTAAFALLFACALILYSFIAGDYSLEYVVKYHTDTTSELALLYKISGLWGGREGSLLFWACLIAIFNAVVAVRTIKKRESLDNMALFVAQLVLLAFVAVLLFSDSNMPFVPLDARYFDADGSLKTYTALMLESSAGAVGISPGIVAGMNPLLEHWAMAIHPPTLFIGYAGLTIPFAYAIAALIVNDPSKKWVERAQRYTMFSWVFLGIGIGLGAVWAYVVLGWGGYWGWDPVENASLLSWIVAVAMVHSFTVYRQRGAFKAWAIFCACLTFSFVILGTFITRSGVIQNSVHAFDGDTVSMWLFLGLIVFSLLAGIVGLIIRWKRFKADNDDTLGDSMMTKGVMYFFNNVILVISAVVIAYLTLATALPSWLPFGGYSFSAQTYNAIARPLTIIYATIMAIGPLLSWIKTDWTSFRKKALVPGILALATFGVLLFSFFTYLVPSYNASIAAGGSHAEEMLAFGSPIYYFGLTILGMLVASILFFNSLFLIGRTISAQAKAKNLNPFAACFSAMRNRASAFGGFLAHLSIAVILIGLIGSSMYVTHKTSYIPFDPETGKVTEAFVINDYRMEFVSSNVEVLSADDRVYSVTFNAYKGDQYIGQVTPGMHSTQSTQQRIARASVITGPVEDLFVVFNGITEDNSMSMAGYVNPFVIYVWIGFGILVLGTTIATVGRRTSRASANGDVVAVETLSSEPAPADEEAAGVAEDADKSEVDEKK